MMTDFSGKIFSVIEEVILIILQIFVSIFKKRSGELGGYIEKKLLPKKRRDFERSLEDRVGPLEKNKHGVPLLPANFLDGIELDRFVKANYSCGGPGATSHDCFGYFVVRYGSSVTCPHEARDIDYLVVYNKHIPNFYALPDGLVAEPSYEQRTGVNIRAIPYSLFFMELIVGKPFQVSVMIDSPGPEMSYNMPDIYWQYMHSCMLRLRYSRDHLIKCISSQINDYEEIRIKAEFEGSAEAIISYSYLKYSTEIQRIMLSEMNEDLGCREIHRISKKRNLSDYLGNKGNAKARVVFDKLCSAKRRDYTVSSFREGVEINHECELAFQKMRGEHGYG